MDTPTAEPYPESSAEQETSEPETSAQPTTAAPRRARRLSAAGPSVSRWSAFAALAIALVALGLAIGAWLRPSHQGAQSFTDQQTADAKAKVCAESTAVRRAVVSQTHLQNPLPGDPNGALAVAANARLALYSGGDYLRYHLASEPAAPADLAQAVTKMADTLQQLSIGYMSGAPDFVQDPLRHTLDAQLGEVDKLCQ